ncbi:hypothetical protein EXE58_00410 [Nocardioides seonyuensis]|uniref:Uncharacterized protein n=1 Tax=Nocardioides seonyuensis TaxID=2518371 RepID=A0A4P7IAR0_9ACTN|nr:histidine kinase [Nocardioides seonyuensis]QBX54085.1 hypothetical protein EXE58_00410 [Nocardioides seonyuensis]
MATRRSVAVDQQGLVNPSLQWWRVTTAVRVFTLALATGILISDRAIGEAGPLLAAIAIIAGVSSALEWGRAGVGKPWIPLGEAALSALILTTAESPPGLFAYLVVPPVIAGLRHGIVRTVNTASVGALAVLAALAVSPDPDRLARLGATAPWLLAGLGAGLLASWQSRSTRDLDERLAPYTAAHQLMTQLHTLARSGAVGLDSAMVSAELGTALRDATGAKDSSVFHYRPDGEVTMTSSHGAATGVEEQATEVDRGGFQPRAGKVVVPLRGAERLHGAVVLGGVSHWDDTLNARAKAVADEFALRLDTAVLFDDVRSMAMSEERNRIAREMHDGVAQEIVALGYIVDEIESVSPDPETRALAGGLRDEISRIVTELRYSIFDLRQALADRRLSGALADYVREVSQDTDLRVHLVLDDSRPPLGSRIENELLRIAQEAIGNVRRHARATNLWVTYVSDDTELRLQVDDDGVGNASAKDRHWGLQTMHERATSIGADLTVRPRPGGGTTVCLTSRTGTATERSDQHEHVSPAD